MRKAAAGLGTLALLAAMASGPTARADETTDPEPQGLAKGHDALNVTGSALVVGGGLALLPAAYVGATVAVGALEPGGAERAAKDFQEPIVFAPLAAGFCAIMIGAALLVVVSPPTSTPARSSSHGKQAAQGPRFPFLSFTF
jgi:hypothetical protein